MSRPSPRAAPANDETDQAPCHVGVVFALGIEAGGFLDKLRGRVTIRGSRFAIEEGGLAGRGVAVLICGAGQEAARAGAETLLAGHRPRWILSAGFAGGLQPGVDRHDLIMVNSLTNADDTRIAVDVGMQSQPLAQGKLHVGRLLTVDHVVHTSAEKTALGQKHDALAVDMESWAVADLCRARKYRFLAVRVISDPVEEELPADVERLVNARSLAGRLGAATGALFRRPSSAKDLWRLRENALQSSERLASFLESIISQLPTS